MFNLKKKLQKTRDNLVAPLSKIFQRGHKLTDADRDSIEELLLSADVGVEACDRIMTQLEENNGVNNKLEFLRDEFLRLLGANAEDDETQPAPGTRAIVVIGVNGVGKTTSIAKLANYHKQRGESVILAASDTFRAAAADQLSIWAQRIGVDIVRHKDGGDPGAVAFDACNAGKTRGTDVVIIDTAGRLHTRVNLMEELKKIKRVCEKVLGAQAVSTYLALDATLGQNSLIQASEFTKALPVDGIILTKLDSTARGGIVIAIKQSLGIPVNYIGVGEKLDDFSVFSPNEFIEALLG